MSILSWMTDPVDERGLWTRCHQCGAIIYLKHLREDEYICSSCKAHLKMNGRERLESLIEPDTWQPFDETLSSVDPLNFTDQRSYLERLDDSQFETNFQEAVITGTGLLYEIPVALAIMDFSFMGGSMGSVVGEKITRLIEYATQKGLILIIVCASGGARMQEGVFSLMQMAKISSALNIYQHKAKLMYISVLTSPTTGGVTASFAMLGDLIFAEPNALIGFAGRRVIQQTLGEEEELPDDFQTAEYFLDHGLLDLIVSRDFLKVALFETINLYYEAPLKYRTRKGKISPNLFKSSNFLNEEKFRRKLKRRNYRNGLTKKTKLYFSKDDLPRVYKNAEKVFKNIQHTNKQNLSISNRKQRKLIKFNQKMFRSLNLLYDI